MQIPNLFETTLGMYMAQSFLHALVATLITGAAIEAWRIESPVVRQRFRLSVILLSIFSFPLYQLIDSDRSTLFFRAEALLDSSRWLELELGGMLPLHLVLFMVFVVTSFIFIFQEMLPILRHFIVPTVEPHLAVVKPAPGSPVSKALLPLAQRLPAVFIIHDDDSVLFSTTFKDPAVYISAGLAKKLTPDQLRAAVAHEIAHISRSKRPILLGGFVLRTLMFFNPVVLVEFRRAIRNEEKICDDIAVGITGEPSVLAEALRRFYFYDESELPEQAEGASSFKMNLEEYSHGLQLETRIARLEQHSDRNIDEGWFPLCFSLAVIIVTNFYIV